MRNATTSRFDARSRCKRSKPDTTGFSCIRTTESGRRALLSRPLNYGASLSFRLILGPRNFGGGEIHFGHYRSPDEFVDQHVLVVGGGNSGVQILAELSKVADVIWVTPTASVFLPDDVDGRTLFERVTARWKAAQAGREPDVPAGGLSDIVMVPAVRDANQRGILHNVRPFVRFEPDDMVWADGTRSLVDAVICCTAFRSALDHLKPLGVLEADGRVAVQDGRSVKEPRLWLVGYGDWIANASATLAGVTRAARATVTHIREMLASTDQPKECH